MTTKTTGTPTNNEYQKFNGAFTAANSQNSVPRMTQLTLATKEVVANSRKAEEATNTIFAAISQAVQHPNPEHAKKLLISLFKGIDDKQASQQELKTVGEIAETLKTIVNTRFATQKTPGKAVGAGNQAIMKQIAQQQELQRKDSIAGDRVSKFAPMAALAANIGTEIEFKFSSQIFQQGVANIQQLTSTLQKINDASTEKMSYQDLEKLLNEARGAMQTAQDIVIQLAAYETLDTKQLQQQIENLKEQVRKAISPLSEQMENLINSDKCAEALEVLATNGSAVDQQRIENCIELYQQTGKQALAVVHFEESCRAAEEAQKAFAKETNENQQIALADKALQTTAKALTNTADALQAFSEVAAVVPKYTNRFLDKLRNAQKVLSTQSQQVVENPKLKDLLQAKPEVKQIVAETAKATLNACAEAQAMVQKIEEPQESVQIPEKYKPFFASIQKAIALESKLDEKIKTDLKNLAQRAIPLMKIQDAGQLSEADSFSLTFMFYDYLKTLDYIYSQLGEKLQVSLEENTALNAQMKQDGIHALADFMRTIYAPEFEKFTASIKKRAGENIVAELYNKQQDTIKKYKTLSSKVEEVLNKSTTNNSAQGQSTSLNIN